MKKGKESKPLKEGKVKTNRKNSKRTRRIAPPPPPPKVKPINKE